MATPAMPPLSWTCTQCGQPVPAGQPNCLNCTGAGAPPLPVPRPPRHRLAPAQPPAGPACPHCGAVQPQPGLGFCTACGRPLAAQPQPAPPAPAQPAAPRAPRRALTNPPPVAQSAPRRHGGGNLQYQQRLSGLTVDRHENVINHNWYVFLLWILVLGGLALLAWLVFGGYQWGWHDNPCKPPCTSTSTGASASAGGIGTATKKSSSTRRATRKAQSATPRQVQISGSLDLVHHGVPTQTATAPARSSPASSSSLEEQEVQFWQWAERRDQ